MSLLPTTIYIKVTAGNRGVYELQGDFSVFAPALQIVNTPDGTPISITSLAGDTYPRIWTLSKTIKPPPAGSPTWAETTKRIEDAGIKTDLNTTTADDAKSLLQTFSDGVSSSVSNLYGGLSGEIKTFATLAIIILALLVVLKFKK